MEKFNKDIINIVNSSLTKAKTESALTHCGFLYRENVYLKNTRVEYIVKGDESMLGDKAARTFNVEQVLMTEQSHKEFSHRCFGNDVKPRLDIYVVYTIIINHIYNLVKQEKEVLETAIHLQGTLTAENNIFTSIDDRRSFKFVNHHIHVYRRKKNFFNRVLSSLDDEISKALLKHEIVYQVVDLNLNTFYVYSFNELLNYIVLYMN